MKKKKSKKAKRKWEKGRDALKGGGGIGTIRRIKFKEGTSIIRLIENDYEEAWVHHFPGVNDKGEEVTRRAVCLGKTECPVCKIITETGNTDLKAKHRFYMNVINRKEERKHPDKYFDVELLECGPQIFEQIANFAVDPEYGDPSLYNFKIIRVGTGAKDTKYTVIPSNKKLKLSSRERKLCERESEAGGAYDLTGFTEQRTKEEVEAMLRKGISEEEEEGFEEEETRKKKKRKKKKFKKSKKKKKKRRDEDEDTDF